jgi:hypothetical protein
MSENLVSEYARLVNEFTTVAKSVTTGDLLKVTKAGEWPAAFVVHHMTDSEMQFSIRFLNVLTMEKPNIAPFDEDVYPTLLKYEKRDVAKSLAAIEGISAATSNLLSIADQSAWNRIAIHPEAGEMTVSNILEKVISHYRAHLNQLKEILEAL